MRTQKLVAMALLSMTLDASAKEQSGQSRVYCTFDRSPDMRPQVIANAKNVNPVSDSVKAKRIPPLNVIVRFTKCVTRYRN